MYEQLKLCAELCAHTEKEQGPSSELHDGTLNDGTVLLQEMKLDAGEESYLAVLPYDVGAVLSMDLSYGYTASVHQYIAGDLNVFVCRISIHDGAEDEISFGELKHKLFSRFKDNVGFNEFVSTFKPTAETRGIFTGFGFGACLAQLFSFAFKTYAFLLDPPGSKELLLSLFPRVSSDEMQLYANTYSYSFVTLPNVINTLDAHVGRLYRIKIPIELQTSFLSKFDFLSFYSWYNLVAGAVMIALRIAAGTSTVAVPVLLAYLAINRRTNIEGTEPRQRFNKEIQGVMQHDLKLIIQAINLDITLVKLIGMNSWPANLCLPLESLREWVLDILLFKSTLHRLWDESDYIESQIVRRLHGYLESTETAILSEIEISSSIYTNYDKSAEEDECTVRSLLHNQAVMRELTSADIDGKFSRLCSLNLSNNLLDDEIISTLIGFAWFNQLKSLNLSKNNLTLTGLMQLVKFYHSSSAIQAVELTLAENKACFTKDDIEKMSHELEDNKLKSRLTHFNIAGNFLLSTSLGEIIECQRLLSAKASFFGLIGSQVFSSAFRDVKETVSHTQSLVFVVVKSRGISDQHAFMMIEHVSDFMTKQLVVYELLQKNDEPGKAFIRKDVPDLSKDRYKQLLFDRSRDQSAGSLTYKVYPIDDYKKNNLLRKLDQDVGKGDGFNYHKFASQSSQAGGVAAINCAKWVADCLKEIEVSVDLGWLNLPVNLVDERGWFRRAVGF